MNRWRACSYVLLRFDADGADLFRVSLSSDGKKLTFEPAARETARELQWGRFA